MNGGEEGEASRRPASRFLTQQADLPWDGARTEATIVFRVPAGANWKVLGTAVGIGPETVDFGSALVYLNAIQPSSLYDVIPASVGGYQAKGSPAPITLGENTRVIIRVRAAAAPPANNVAFANLYVEQTITGPPPEPTQHTGEF